MPARDIHSYSNPAESRVSHVELDLAVSFREKQLRGAVTLALETAGKTLVLDTRDLNILRVNGSAAGFTLGPRDQFLGSPLTIQLPRGARSVVVEYETSPQASGLQWLDPAQTAGKQHPFLFSQSQAIHARSWIPIQDSPGVRVTYSARINAPLPLTPLMSARIVRPGHFHLPQPVPPYLIALAVGELKFKALSQRCGVWAEPSVLDKAAHELAHSWSGNLVTNSTWRDFWLNEGFTTYIERRIQEVLYGRRRSEMEFAIETGELDEEMKGLPPADQKLAIDLTGRDPDDGLTGVPYVKGALLLRRLEEEHGREKFDAWLRSYFDHFAFQSISSEEFVAFLRKSFPGENVDAWLHQPGLPPDAPRIRFDFGSTPTHAWSTQEWLHWLRAQPADLTPARMSEMDQQWDFTRSGNSEIAAQWLLMAIRAGYQPAYARLEQFLVEVGRRKFVKPLFEALVKTGEGKVRAEAIYKKARPGYHPITQAAVDAILR